MHPYTISIFLNPDEEFAVANPASNGSTRTSALKIDYEFSLENIAASMRDIDSFAASIKTPEMRQVLGDQATLWDAFLGSARAMLAALSGYCSATGDVVGFELYSAAGTQVMIVSVENTDPDDKLSYGGYTPERLVSEAENYTSILITLMDGEVPYDPQLHMSNVWERAQEEWDAQESEQLAEQERARQEELTRIEQMKQVAERQAEQQKAALSQMDAMMAQAQKESLAQTGQVGQQAQRADYLDNAIVVFDQEDAGASQYVEQIYKEPIQEATPAPANIMVNENIPQHPVFAPFQEAFSTHAATSQMECHPYAPAFAPAPVPAPQPMPQQQPISAPIPMPSYPAVPQPAPAVFPEDAVVPYPVYQEAFETCGVQPQQPAIYPAQQIPIPVGEPIDAGFPQQQPQQAQESLLNEMFPYFSPQQYPAQYLQHTGNSW